MIISAPLKSAVIVMVFFILLPSCREVAKQRTGNPNVILILTDDQGYGDIAAHGNNLISTPNLDRLFGESIRLTNYHVSPTCSPTRAALLTGRYNNRTGVWHTVTGRSRMREDETTMAQIFSGNGYETGMFGKWHLGFSYPAMPMDKRFKTAVYHGNGGIGNTPDWWDNDYFDDFRMIPAKGESRLNTKFTNGSDISMGAYYVYLNKLHQ